MKIRERHGMLLSATRPLGFYTNRLHGRLRTRPRNRIYDGLRTIFRRLQAYQLSRKYRSRYRHFAARAARRNFRISGVLTFTAALSRRAGAREYAISPQPISDSGQRAPKLSPSVKHVSLADASANTKSTQLLSAPAQYRHSPAPEYDAQARAVGSRFSIDGGCWRASRIACYQVVSRRER